VQIRAAERLLGSLDGEVAARKKDVAFRAAAWFRCDGPLGSLSILSFRFRVRYSVSATASTTSTTTADSGGYCIAVSAGKLIEPQGYEVDPQPSPAWRCQVAA
jgi:hypothetical protein